MRYRRYADPAAACGVALALACVTALAQDNDLILPPRLDGAPFSARLAEPRQRDDSLEEVVVVGENEWRLPDLGSTWRVEQEESRVPARIEADFLPLYDPESAREQRVDLFLLNDEVRRVGFVELFRIRFGRRSRD